MAFLPEASITVYALPTTPTAFQELLVLVIPVLRAGSASASSGMSLHP
jgi:hypothetical protein